MSLLRPALSRIRTQVYLINMEIVNNKTGRPIEQYQAQFAASDPKELASKSGILFDGEKFRLKLMNRPVSISYPSMEVVFEDEGKNAADYTRILLSRLVMEGCIIPAKGEMYAYTDMPWGNVYAVQFRGRCIMRLAGTYGHNIEGFKSSCESLGFIKASAGDVSFDVPFVEGLTVRLILWEGDDEFPPAAQILFSDNFPSAFTAEDMAVVGDVILNALKGRW